MVFNILLALSLSKAYNCGDTRIENTSTEEWNEVDDKNLASAMDRCVVHFPNSPCLKVFTKTNHQAYTAICTQEVKNNGIY